MRKELDLIEKIEQYTEGTLSEAEMTQFEANLSYDTYLQEEVQLQKELIDGIERKVLKKEIDQAYKKYQHFKDLQRMVLMGVGLLLIVASATYFYTREAKTADVLVAAEKTVVQEPGNSTQIPDFKEQITSEEVAPVNVEVAAIKKEPALPKKKETVSANTTTAAIEVEPKAEKKTEITLQAPDQVVAEKNGTTNLLVNQKIKNESITENPVIVQPKSVEPVRESIAVAEPQRTDAHPKLFIPSAFTPNGDGVNDVFKIPSEGIVDLRCIIYTLVGEIVYEWSGIEGSWDGKTGIEKSSEEVFIYNVKVKYAGAQNYTQERAGTVTLVK